MCLDEEKSIKFLMSNGRIELKLSDENFRKFRSEIDGSFLSGNLFYHVFLKNESD